MLPQNGPDFWFPDCRRCYFIDIPNFGQDCHGPLIFYLVSFFPGTGKRVDAVTKWLWSCWALTKMSDCRKLHDPLIFYLVFSFSGTGKRVDAATKWPGFLVSRWHWALTKMSDCQRCSFFDIPSFGLNCMVH